MTTPSYDVIMTTTTYITWTEQQTADGRWESCEDHGTSESPSTTMCAEPPAYIVEWARESEVEGPVTFRVIEAPQHDGSEEDYMDVDHPGRRVLGEWTI